MKIVLKRELGVHNSDQVWYNIYVDGDCKDCYKTEKDANEAYDKILQIYRNREHIPTTLRTDKIK